MNQKKIKKISFFEDTKAELNRVTWPGRKKILEASFIIVMIMIFSTILVGSLDMFFSKSLFFLKTVLN